MDDDFQTPVVPKSKKVMPTKRGKSSEWSRNKKNANRMKAVRGKETKAERDKRNKKDAEAAKKRKSELSSEALQALHNSEAKRLRQAW